MARISLLFTLALVLAIGSVLAHPPSHKKTKKTLCPPTLDGLKAFPYNEISKLIKKTSQSSPNTIQFQTLFAICMAYNDHLAAFSFFDVKEVVDKVPGKYALMTEAMRRAEAFIGVEGELAVKLRKSYAAMAEGYVHVTEKVGAISAKYKFNGDAKISQSDRAEIEKCVIKLRGSIRVFIKVISECNKKYSAKKPNTDLLGVFAKQKISHADKLIGNGHGKVGAGVDVGAKAIAHAGAKVGGQGKAKVGVHGGAKAGGKIGGLFGGIFGLGGKTQFDASGKASIGGGH